MKLELNSQQISQINLALRMAMTIWADNYETAKATGENHLSAQLKQLIAASEEIIEQLFDEIGDRCDNCDAYLHPDQLPDSDDGYCQYCRV
jgi:hypothetical protein